ncbi:type II secretion system ATPase GspE [Woodsholea maritima]|uniref:type II secretion system ATPase GspE n=1 Tax=Woodsholea maritima TaxID=240237 RepID=UPI0003721111|nr:type II secretion system ATPase GspE [Woodsholea maritima]
MAQSASASRTKSPKDLPAITYAFAREQGVALITGDEPVFVLRDGANPMALVEARRAVGQAYPVTVYDGARFDRALSEIYAFDGLNEDAEDAGAAQDDDLSRLIDEIPKTEDLLDSSSDAPIIRLINGLIAEAVRTGASDIHVEPYEDRVSVRLRVDGVLRETLSLSAKVASPLVSRIKVMARLDIAEKRVPQDGRITLTLGGKGIDVRVSTLPSRYGERVVLRLLDKDSARFTLQELGMAQTTLVDLQKALSQPNGIVLVTGPTGAGKTTTLYAGLNLLNDKSRNILTVEDPVEYAVPGIGQTQVNTKVGMTFAAGLRAILRQDPDVVMVGEIRDVETAEIAVQASLTGHLVLSTVHTNSAIAAIARLRDMGVEAYLLASTVSAIVAQRLVRKLCHHCKDAYTPDEAERQILGLSADEAVTLYRPMGCPSCKGTGYSGRRGVYELVIVDDKLRGLIHDQAREGDMAAHAFAQRPTLYQAGIALAQEGVTSLAEVLRVCREDSER